MSRIIRVAGVGVVYEHLFLVGANFASFYISALFVGSLVSILEKQFSSREQWKVDRANLMQFLSKRNVPAYVRTRVTQSPASFVTC